MISNLDNPIAFSANLPETNPFILTTLSSPPKPSLLQRIQSALQPQHIARTIEKIGNHITTAIHRLQNTPQPKQTAATLSIGTLYGVLFSSLLLAPLPSGEVKAQSSGSVNHYGDGDKITKVKKGGKWKG